MTAAIYPAYPHLAVIGRLDGDDEDSVLMYEDMTIAQAEKAFKRALQAAERGDKPRDECHTQDEIYITYILTSSTPMAVGGPDW